MNQAAPRDSKVHRRLDVVVRAAIESDALDVTRIYNQHIDSGESTFDKVHWTAERMQRLLGASPPEGWYVAIEHSQLIGWANLRQYSLRPGYRFTCETGIYLDQSAIGRGIGDMLQKRVEDHCRTHGIHHAVARIATNNRPSMAFHLRHGYELVGIQKEIGHMRGEWVDVAILQRLFPDT